MSQMGITLVCNKCKKFKVAYDELGKKLIKAHMRDCNEIPDKPGHTTVDKL